MNKIFIFNLKMIRLSKGLSQAEYSEQLGLSSSKVAQVENGRIKNIQAIADAVSNDIGVPSVTLVTQKAALKF